MEGFSKWGTSCTYLMLVGYPTETQKDFEDTLNLFKRHQRYVANETILGCTLGVTMRTSPDAPISEQYGHTFTTAPNTTRNSWVSNVVPGLDLGERIRRRLVAHRIAESYGWSIISADRELRKIKEEAQQWMTGSFEVTKESYLMDISP